MNLQQQPNTGSFTRTTTQAISFTTTTTTTQQIK